MTTKVVDSKGRLTLGNQFAGKTVIVDDSNPQKIVITPAAVIPESDAWLYRNKKALNSVRRGLREAQERRFAKRAPDLDDDAPLAAESGE